MRKIVTVQEDENVLISKSAFYHKPSVGRYCWVTSIRTISNVSRMIFLLTEVVVIGIVHHHPFQIPVSIPALWMIAVGSALISMLSHSYNTGMSMGNLEFRPNHPTRNTWNAIAAVVDLGQQSFRLGAIFAMVGAVTQGDVKVFKSVTAFMVLAILSFCLATVSICFSFINVGHCRRYTFLPEPHRRDGGSDYDLDNSEEELILNIESDGALLS